MGYPSSRLRTSYFRLWMMRQAVSAAKESGVPSISSMDTIPSRGQVVVASGNLSDGMGCS